MSPDSPVNPTGDLQPKKIMPGASRWPMVIGLGLAAGVLCALVPILVLTLIQQLAPSWIAFR